MYFDELPLDDDILDALDSMNFEKCSPIQEKAIPPILEGRDIIGIAQTGTGKTAAYLLPILNKLNTGNYPNDAINCIIMSPTRELAQQIDQQVEGFGYFINGVSSVAVYGGNDGTRFEQERKGLEHGASIIIATPGRLLSHLAGGHIDLKRVSFFVLDEADRMLDMGFYDDIMKITSYMSQERQTILFSATMPNEIQKLAKNILCDPIEIKIAVSKPAEKIKQTAYICHDGMKDKIVESILSDKTLDRVIIFASSKQKVKELTRSMKQKKFKVEAMHSDLDQKERDYVMHEFKNRRISILIATDIVSRGIDIDDIQLVINYDVPRDPEDYVHRIGRTARANREGQAATLVSQKDYYLLRKIEKLIEKEIEKPELPEGCGEKPVMMESKGNKNSRHHGKQKPKYTKGNGQYQNKNQNNNRKNNTGDKSNNNQGNNLSRGNHVKKPSYKQKGKKNGTNDNTSVN